MHAPALLRGVADNALEDNYTPRANDLVGLAPWPPYVCA
jgi:hypothetical protein